MGLEKGRMSNQKISKPDKQKHHRIHDPYQLLLHPNLIGKIGFTEGVSCPQSMHARECSADNLFSVNPLFP